MNSFRLRFPSSLDIRFYGVHANLLFDRVSSNTLALDMPRIVSSCSYERSDQDTAMHKENHQSASSHLHTRSQE